MTFYLKYRPQTIDQLDSENVRETLKKIIASKSLPHAFLFAGPKGIGKTSSARILAKVINCEKNIKAGTLSEPCNKCATCLAISKGNHIDVIEMDAASNRGIDDVRALKENIALAPQSAAKKIYIIDEAHMLTTEAANALLKTLEEPPEHVVFIFATTNPEKLPDTIHSRLSIVEFSKANSKEVARQLKRVIDGEKLKVEEGALEQIAKAADGSFRDAVKIIEQLSSLYPQISEQNAMDYLFQSNILQVEKIIDLLVKRDAKAVLSEVERVANSGGSIKTYIDQITTELHKQLLVHAGVSKGETKFDLNEIKDLLSALQIAKSALATSTIAQLPLELALVKWLNLESPMTASREENSNGETDKEEEKEIEAKKEQSLPRAETSMSNINKDIWDKLLLALRDKNASIEALLRSSKPMDFDGKTLRLGVYYQFHKERLEVGQNRKTLEEVAEDVFGNPVHFDCQLTEKPPSPQKTDEVVLTDATKPDIINAAKEIFG